MSAHEQSWCWRTTTWAGNPVSILCKFYLSSPLATWEKKWIVSDEKCTQSVVVLVAWTCIGFSKNKRSFRDFATSIHGSYNLEKVSNFNSCLSKSLNSVNFLEKYLISLLGLRKFLKFATVPKNIFLHEQYLNCNSDTIAFHTQSFSKAFLRKVVENNVINHDWRSKNRKWLHGVFLPIRCSKGD